MSVGVIPRAASFISRDDCSRPTRYSYSYSCTTRIQISGTCTLTRTRSQCTRTRTRTCTSGTYVDEFFVNQFLDVERNSQICGDALYKCNTLTSAGNLHRHQGLFYKETFGLDGWRHLWRARSASL